MNVEKASGYLSKKVLVLVSLWVFAPVIVWSQYLDTLRVIDFSDSSFQQDMCGVEGFYQKGFTRGSYGAKGAPNDWCAYTDGFSHLDTVAMRVSLEAGKSYRLTLNGRASGLGQQIDFWYTAVGVEIKAKVIALGVPLDKLSYDEPGASIASRIFSVKTDGNYWVVLSGSSSSRPGVTVCLDNFLIEVVNGESVPPLSLLDSNGKRIVQAPRILSGLSSTFCISPDKKPTGEVALRLSLAAHDSPHFDNFTPVYLNFPAGSTETKCFELSPNPDTIYGAYVFQLSDREGKGVMHFEVTVEPPCRDISGPDRTICAGDRIQLGTGCLPWPHPIDGVDYCYAWKPRENLFTHLSSSMPTVFPTETTTYTVYVTDSNGDLIAEDQVTVNVNSIKIEEWDKPRICPGESVTIAPVILSEGKYSYLWENGATTPAVEVELLHYTNFGLRITDEDTDCKEQFEFPVFVERPPDIGIISTYPELCELADPIGLKDEDPVSRSSNECPQTSTNLYAGTGIPGYSYEWSTGETTDKITVDEAGFYWVTVTKDGKACSATDVYEVGSCATAEIQIGEDVAGNPILDAGGEPGSTYEWQDGSTAQTIEITGLGFYAVTVTNSEGCIAKDGFIVKGYEYDPEDVFLVYYTEWGNEKNVDIYIQHNLQQGQDKTEYQEIIRTAVTGKIANFNQKNIRYFWNEKVDHQVNKPIVRGQGKFFPMIIDGYPGKEEKLRIRHFYTGSRFKPYHFKLKIEHKEHRGELIKGEVQLDNPAIFPLFEPAAPDFPLGYKGFGQYVEAGLLVGESEKSGQRDRFDRPALSMNIEFEPPLAKPRGYRYALFLDGKPAPQKYEIEVGNSVVLQVKNETIGEFVSQGDHRVTDLHWTENRVRVNGANENGGYTFTSLPSMSGEEVVVRVRFMETRTQKIIKRHITMKLVTKDYTPGVSITPAVDTSEAKGICVGSPCEAGSKSPSIYAERALAQLRQDTAQTIYNSILSQLEEEGYHLDIRLRSEPGECEVNKGHEVQYSDNAFYSLKVNWERLLLGTTETTTLNRAPGNRLADCFKHTSLLVTLSESQKEEIKTLILEAGEEVVPVYVRYIEQRSPLLGAKLASWITNEDDLSITALRDKADQVDQLYEEKKLAYELTEENFPSHKQLLHIDDKKLIVINMYVKALSFIPTYASYTSGFWSGAGSEDIWDYYKSENPDCHQIRRLRQQKYRECLAHELTHLYLIKTQPLSYLKWVLIQDAYGKECGGFYSKGYCPFCKIHDPTAAGSNDGSHASQPEAHRSVFSISD